LSVESDFETLRQAVIKADEENMCDCRPMELPLVQLLELVRSHPEKRGYFVDEFIRIAIGELDAPPELIPFCMRELRYPEVLQAVRYMYEALQAENQHARYMSYCSHVTKAYSDFVWEEGSMWDYYRAKELIPSIVPELIPRISSESSEEVFNALFALEEIGPAAKSAIPAIEAFLRTPRGQTNLGGRARLALRSIAGLSEPAG
jgi:hypothetical protein